MIECADGCGFGSNQNPVKVNPHRRAVVGGGDERICIERNQTDAAQAVKRRFIAEAKNDLTVGDHQKSVGLTIAAAETAFKHHIARSRRRVNPRINGQRVGRF